MTEKRFINEDGCWGYYTEIIDNEKELDLSLPNPKKNLTINELVDLLNELHEENTMLKERRHEDINDLSVIAMKYQALEKENEQLKRQVGNLEHTRDFCAECCERLEKENEQLKSEIREVRGAYEELWMRL